MALRRSLGKDADGPVSRWLNRPLSTRLSMVPAPLRPAPDLVSLVAFTFGLAGAALLATGQGLGGGLLVHASSVADGVDGEVARLDLRRGPRGALLDGCWTAGTGGAAGCRGRGPGRTGRGPGRGLGHLGAVARPAGRLSPPTADRLTTRHSLPASE